MVAVLTPKQERFVREYLVDLNATQAAIRAGYSAKTAKSIGQENLTKPDVKAAIAAARQKQSEETGISAKRALEEVWSIATADTRELVEYVVGCCRYCHGKGHRYQRTAAEFARDEAAQAKANEDAIEAGKPVKEFDRMGGIGYDERKEPDPNCPECFGRGVGRTLFKDTRKVSRGAAALFAGVKETKDGLEIKLHPKDSALEKVFKHLGLYEKDNSQLGAAFAEKLIKARERAGKA